MPSAVRSISIISSKAESSRAIALILLLAVSTRSDPTMTRRWGQIRLTGPFFREFLGRFAQSLTRWPLNVGDRHEPADDHKGELHHLKGRGPS